VLSSEQTEFIPLNWVKLTEKCIYFYYCDSITETTEVLVILWTSTKCPDNTHNRHYRKFDLVFSWLKRQVMWSLPFLLPWVPTTCSPRCGEAGPSSWYSLTSSVHQLRCTYGTETQQLHCKAWPPVAVSK